jgi:hypothetical protein
MFETRPYWDHNPCGTGLTFLSWYKEPSNYTLIQASKWSEDRSIDIIFNISSILKKDDVYTVETYVKDREESISNNIVPGLRKVMRNAVPRSRHYSNSASCYLVEGKERFSIFRDPL